MKRKYDYIKEEGKKITRRFFSFLLAFLLCVSMLPISTITAHAETVDYVATVTVEDTLTSYSSVDAAFTYANSQTDPCTVTLYADCSVSSQITIPSGADITLDLAGYKLTGSGENILFNIRYGKLTLEDSSKEGTGTLFDSYGCINTFYGTFVMNGGRITGAGGNISSQGISINGGTVVMNGGEISGNTGTGVNVVTGTFTMNDGTISNNQGKASSPVGGVYLSGNTAKFVMKGGKISGNTGYGDYPGGVYLYAAACKFSVSGSPVISGNVAASGSASNVYLVSGSTIILDGDLTEDAKIGVSTAVAPTESNSVQITTAETETSYYGEAAQYLVSDGGYYSWASKGGYVVLSSSAAFISDETTYYITNAEASALTVEAAGILGTDLSYQWYKNSTSSSEGAEKIAQATESSYTPSTETTGTTYYYCVVTAGSGEEETAYTSNMVSVVVRDYAVTVTTGDEDAETESFFSVQDAFTYADGLEEASTVKLLADVDTDSTLTVSDGSDITLDLAGRTLSSSSSICILTVKGTLTLKDSSEDGKGTVSGGTSGVYLYYPTAIFNMTGGTVANASSYGVYAAGYKGAVINISGGTITDNNGGGVSGYTINITDGAITNNISSSTSYAGGVTVAAFSGILNMSGGTISGNTGTRYGGIYSNYGTVNISGGTITDNIGASYGGIYASGDNKLHISGSPVITGNKKSSDSENETNVYILSGQTFILNGEMEDGADVGITVAKTPSESSRTKFTSAETDTGYYKNAAKYFSSDQGYFVWENTDGYLEMSLYGTNVQPEISYYLVDMEAETLTAGINSVLGDGLSGQWYSNTEKSNTSGEKIDGATETSYTPSTTTAGTVYYYYVATDKSGNEYPSNTVQVTVKNNYAAKVTVGEESENTATTYYTLEQAFEAANEAEEATVTLLENCEISTGLSVSSGGSVALDLAGYTISVADGVKTYVIYVSNGTFTLKDSSENETGTITGGYHGNLAGGVCVYGSTGNFVMESGTLTGNHGYYGGAVCVYAGTFTMSGGTITGNTGTYGGGVFVFTSNGTFSMNGGTITGNTASNKSGGIYSGGTFNLSGNPVIADNMVGENISNVYLYNSMITLAGELEEGADIGINFDGKLEASDSIQVTSTESETEYYITAKPYFTSDEGYMVRSNEAGYLEIYRPVNAAVPTIKYQSEGAYYVVGGSAEALEVQASVEDGGVLSYQWYSNSEDSNKGGNAITDATESSYTPSTASAGTFYYYCVVTNTNKAPGIDGEQSVSTVSDTAQVIVSDDVQTPVIVTQPQDRIYLEDAQAAALSVEAEVTDGGTLSYQWYSNSINSAEGATAISDATESSYIPSTSTSGTTFYYCIVSNTNEKATGKTEAQTASDIVEVTVVSSGSAAVDDGSELKAYNTVGKAFTYANGLSTSSTVILLEDCEVDDTLTVDAGKDITLDLNGNTLKAAEGTSIGILTVAGTLRLADSSGNNSGTITGGSRAIYLSASTSVLEMNGGTISGNGNTSTDGGAVYGTNGTFTMNDGVICNNEAYNGVVGVPTFTMSGGKINGNTTASYGGGVYATTVVMNGGEISGQNGWGVYTKGLFTMNGGEICNNTSGGVYVYSTTSGSFTMSSGKINGNGGIGLYLDGIKFTMTGGEISENSGGSYAGGVYIYNTKYTATFAMSGGKISGNTSTSYGGGVRFGTSRGVSITMAGGEISGNTSTSSGGGMYVTGSSSYPATFSMSGGRISDNSGILGGGIYFSGGTFTMKAGEISGNHGTQGGGVYARADTTMNVTGGEITDNEATKYGGGIWFYNTSSTILNLSRTPVITGNTLVTTDDEGNQVRSANNIYLQKNQYISLSGKLTENAEVGITTVTAPADGAPVEVTGAESGTTYYKTAVKCFTSDAGYYFWENADSGYAEMSTYAANITSATGYYLVNDNAETLTVESSSLLGSDLSYQWYSNTSDSNTGGTAISDAVSAEYTPSTASAGTTWYYCMVTSGSGETAVEYPTNTIKVVVTEDYTVTVTSAGDEGTDTKKYISVSDAFDYANSLSTAATVTLLSDFELENTLMTASGKEITLDLNGKTLKARAGRQMSILTVAGTLTLKDSSEDASGKLTGGLGIVDGTSTYGGGVYVTGSFYMESGTISGNSVSGNTYCYGGGVYVGIGADFQMKGGTISNNESANYGGGVHVQAGKFTLSGGEISENAASNGGGVGLTGSGTSTSTFTMDGGIISDNMAKTYGGGIYDLSGTATINGGKICDNTTDTYGGGIYTQVAFTIEDCTITGNYAENGGGICVYKGTLTVNDNVDIKDNVADSYGGGVYLYSYTRYSSSAVMSGGEISGNEAGESGGGVYVSRYSSTYYGTLSVKGSSVITGNTVDEKANNVYLPADQTLSIGGALNEDANIGVTTATIPADGSTVQITGSNTISYTEGVLDAITSDAGYGVRWGGSYYLVLYEAEDTSGVEENVATVSNGTDTISFKTVNEAFAYANGLETASKITLLSDCSTTYETLTVAAKKEITLDLNGNILSTPDGAMISVLTVNGTLTLEDSSDEGTGTVTGGMGTIQNAVFGGGVYVAGGGTFNLKSGKISGNSSTLQYSYGGGVYVAPEGTFNMSGGEISGNTLSGSSSYGGGVYVKPEGTFNMSGGEISGNTLSGSSYTYGGGVFVSDSAVFNVSGAPVISGNTSENVYLFADLENPAMTLAGSLSDGAAIGITSINAPTEDNPVAITTAESDTSYYASAEQYITADNALYGIHANTSGGYLEVYLVTDSTDATAPVISETQLEEASYTYGDSAETVTALSVTANEPTRGTLSYQWYSSDSADGEGTAIEGATNAAFTPSTAKAGTLYYYCVVTNTDSSATMHQTASVTTDRAAVTVNKAAPQITLSDKEASYTGEAVSIDAAKVTLLGEDTVPEDVQITYTYYSDETCETALEAEPAEVGVYYVKASLPTFGNYNAAQSEAAKLTITKGFNEAGVSAVGYTGTYDAQSHEGITVTLSGAAQGAEVTYKTSESAQYSSEVPAFVDAGTYTVYFKVSKDSYNDVEGSVSVVINKAAQSVSFAQTEVSKAATDAAFTNELTKELVYGAITWSSSDTSVATVNEATGEVTLLKAGETTITATAGGSDNYTTAKASYTLTVADAAFGESDITVEEYSGVYDGEAHAAAITLTGAADGATVTYKTDADAEYTEDVPVFTNAGIYTVYYKVSKANYSDVTGSVKVIIRKADSELSFSEDTVSITTSDTSFSITLEGQIYGDLTWESSDTSVAAVDEDGSVTILGAGSAVITATASGDENHNGASASYTITIADTTGDTIRTNEDGSLGYYVDGVLQTDYTGLVDVDDVSYYVEDGIVQTDFTGTVDEGDTTYYVVNGIVQTNYTGVTQTGDTGYYVVNGVVQTNYTGTVQSGDTWYYVVSGVVSTSYNGFLECGDDWYYFENGSIVTAGYNNRGTDVVKGTIDGTTGWYYVENGKYIPSYTGFASNKNGDWYVEKGIVTFKTSSVIKDTTGAIGTKGIWYYVVGNRVRTDYTGVANYKNANGWWYIKNGQVDFTYTGFSTNSKGSWYVQKGKVTLATNSVIKDTTGAIGAKGTWYYVVRSRVRTDYTGVANYKNTNGWWYIKAGKVDFSFNGLASNNNGWWYVKGGKVQFTYTGIQKNSKGTWYVKNGKVQFTYSGKVTINGKTYTVKNGKVG